MLGSNGTLAAFRDGDMCRWTLGQTGLRDSRTATPGRTSSTPGRRWPTRLEATAASGAVTLRGTVVEQPRKRGRISGGVYFRRDLSILVPHDAQVPGRRRRVAAARGGRRDVREPTEAWTLTTDPLTPGGHQLELEATTGETAGRTRILWAGETPVDLELATDAAFTKTTATVRAGKKARVYVRSTSAGLPVSRLAPVKLVRVTDGRVMTTLTTGENGVWTGTLTPARTRAYEVRFAGAGQFLGPVASARVTVKVQ